jgi:hypothetical protein
MNTKILLPIKLLFVLLLCSSSTYAASNSSLWGDIDEPVVPTKQIEQQQQQLQAQQLIIDNQKTVCELFTAQATLSADTVNAAKIQEALTRAYNSALPDYKMLIANKDAANNLYVQYRNLYLKTYCTGPK